MGSPLLLSVSHINCSPCARLGCVHGHLRALYKQDRGAWLGSLGTTRPFPSPGARLPLASWPEAAACEQELTGHLVSWPKGLCSAFLATR